MIAVKSMWQNNMAQVWIPQELKAPCLASLVSAFTTSLSQLWIAYKNMAAADGYVPFREEKIENKGKGKGKDKPDDDLAAMLAATTPDKKAAYYDIARSCSAKR